MNLGRVLVVARRVLRQILRDRRTLAVIVMQPLVIMAIFGYAFGGDITDAKTIVVNLDRGTFAQDVVDHLDTKKVTVIPASTEAELEARIRNGDAVLGVVFPHNFTRNFESARSGAAPEVTYLRIYKDNTNPQLVGALQGEFADALSDATEDRFDTQAGFVFEDVIVFGGDEGESLEFFVPGIAAFSILMLGSMMTVVSIVKERTQGTLGRVLVSPVTSAEVVAGYASSFGLFSIIQAATVLSVASVVFQVPIRGSLLLAMVATTLTGIVALGFGILVSGVAENEFQATQSVFFLAFPNLFLAGVFAPIESMPAIIRPLSKLVPLTYAVEALRAILNRGATLVEVSFPLTMLALFALAFLGASAVSFGRSK